MFENNDNNEENNSPPPYSEPEESFLDLLYPPSSPTEESIHNFIHRNFADFYYESILPPTYEEIHKEGDDKENIPPPPTPTLTDILNHLRCPIHPYVHVSTGLVHPNFPRTVLAFHLLTEPQLDNLLAHYHQVWPPVFETHLYPVSIPTWLVSGPGACNIYVKRYWFGIFIGLESEVVRTYQVCVPDLMGMFARFDVAAARAEADDRLNEMLAWMEWMEREWLDDLARASAHGRKF